MALDADPNQGVDEQGDFRLAVRELCEAEIGPRAAETDRRAVFPAAGYDALRRRGWHAPRIPEAYGGGAAGALTTAIVIEEVARTCATSALIPAINTLGTITLLAAASEELKRAYLPPIARGEGMVSFCLTEPEAGSDSAAMATRAERRDDGSYLLNGVKRWITHAGVSTLYIVFAVTDPGAGSRGISAFLVEKGDDGVSFGPLEAELGIKGSPTREVHLAGVSVPAWRMIGGPGTGLRTARRALDHGRISIAAQAVGIAQGALEYATDYVKSRTQFGKAVSEFQGVQFMLADMGIRTEAARQLTYAAAVRSETDPEDFTFQASAAKCFASDAAMSVTTDAVQLLGGNGYSCDHPVERMMRDAKITQIYEGTNQIQRIVVARSLLSRGGARD